MRIIEDAQKEERERTAQLNRFEERLLRLQEDLEKGLKEVGVKEDRVKGDAAAVETIKAEAEKARGEVMATLEKIAGMSSLDAREKLFAEVLEAHRKDMAVLMQKLEKERHEPTMVQMRVGDDDRV